MPFYCSFTTKLFYYMHAVWNSTKTLFHINAVLCMIHIMPPIEVKIFKSKCFLWWKLLVSITPHCFIQIGVVKVFEEIIIHCSGSKCFNHNIGVLPSKADAVFCENLIMINFLVTYYKINIWSLIPFLQFTHLSHIFLI